MFNWKEILSLLISLTCCREFEREAKQSSCSVIDEKLWTQESTTGNKDGLQFLQYLAYDSARSVFKLYWIGSSSPYSCHAITPSGEIQSVNCLAYLPVLCTQFAPLSFSSNPNSSGKWQTTASTGKQQIKGRAMSSQSSL